MDRVSCKIAFCKPCSSSLNIIGKLCIGGNLKVHPTIILLIIGKISPDHHTLKVLISWKNFKLVTNKSYRDLSACILFNFLILKCTQCSNIYKNVNTNGQK